MQRALPNAAMAQPAHPAVCTTTCSTAQHAPEKSCGSVYQNMALSVPPLPPQHQYLWGASMRPGSSTCEPVVCILWETSANSHQ